jgi:hypothetical protein
MWDTHPSSFAAGTKGFASMAPDGTGLSISPGLAQPLSACLSAASPAGKHQGLNERVSLDLQTVVSA